MKLVTYSIEGGAPTVGYIEDGEVRPLGGASMLDFIVVYELGAADLGLEDETLSDHPQVALTPVTRGRARVG